MWNGGTGSVVPPFRILCLVFQELLRKLFFLDFPFIGLTPKNEVGPVGYFSQLSANASPKAVQGFSHKQACDQSFYVKEQHHFFKLYPSIITWEVIIFHPGQKK